MSRISSIDRLPSEVREALHGWLRDPAVTQAEAAERTNALLDERAAQRPQEKRAERVSKSAVNRYEWRRRKAAERTRQSRLVADAWVARYGSAPDGPVDHIAVEMLRMVAFDLASRLQDFEIDVESLPGAAETAAKISLMVERLERSGEIALRCDRESKRRDAEEAADEAKAA
ncbi:MAG: DUF3486 family protein, partial [Bryobacterales bacterium]|nr:DUF3486 family protein [Bryobacterales bacterium]